MTGEGFACFRWATEWNRTNYRRAPMTRFAMDYFAWCWMRGLR